MVSDAELGEAAERVAEFYRTFSDSKVEALRALAAPGLRWEDPFVDVTGIDGVIATIHRWSAVLSEIRFEIKDQSRTGRSLFLHMVMTFEVRRSPGKRREIDYVKKVVFDDAGLVVAAKEYWDAAPALETIPILGRAVGLAKRLMSKEMNADRVEIAPSP